MSSKNSSNSKVDRIRQMLELQTQKQASSGGSSHRQVTQRASEGGENNRPQYKANDYRNVVEQPR